MRKNKGAGFVQVRLEVLATGSFAYPGFGSGFTNIAKHWFLIFIFIKSRAAVSGGQNFIATPDTKPCR